jgi:hypothetical protein
MLAELTIYDYVSLVARLGRPWHHSQAIPRHFLTSFKHVHVAR